jgi:predicted aspartyl protease
MGNVFAEITVKNIMDVGLAHAGHITENNVRSVALTAIVDTGATTLVINEEIFNQLGLSVVEKRYIKLAGSGRIECKVTDPVHIQWKDRFAVCGKCRSITGGATSPRRNTAGIYGPHG